ncbi:MAG: hypothetical protein UZ18_ATM001000490, partial [Armatimonadetes bacterium OLB18]
MMPSIQAARYAFARSRRSEETAL